MTLKEKLCEPFDGLKIETSNKLEQIADDYAIEFAAFLNDYLNSTSNRVKTINELLKIFKKEKGL